MVIARPSANPDRPGESFEIYMLRRSAKSPFMPSTLVYPGGRVDPEDGPEDADDTWVRAGRRECQEEAGLDPGPSLSWFDTWLTPSAESRRRYLARFFLARLEAGAGEEAQADDVETHEGRWNTVVGHLQQWEQKEVDLPPPTLCTLLRMRTWTWVDLERLDAMDPHGVILPKVQLTKSGPTIVMPHDPDYPDLDGEALPSPNRATDLPRRFVRDGTVWRPLAD